MTVNAPAKINLSLKITHKREDGFHELETLVLPLPKLADRLSFTLADQYHLHCETPGVPTDDTNLVSQALRIFSEKSGKPCPYQIELVKKVPHGAGLGGGSADAAATFLALNELTKANLPLETLADWAAPLGSDIPLFLYRSPCWCRGRGEIIEPLDLPWHHDILLLKPSFPIPTPWAYSKWQDSTELHGIPYHPQEVEDLLLFNDLERPVFEKHRFLAELKRFLLAQNETKAALMSGSGSTIFAVLNPGADGHALQKRTLAEMDPTMWTHLEKFT